MLSDNSSKSETGIVNTVVRGGARIFDVIAYPFQSTETKLLGQLKREKEKIQTQNDDLRGLVERLQVQAIRIENVQRNDVQIRRERLVKLMKNPITRSQLFGSQAYLMLALHQENRIEEKAATQENAAQLNQNLHDISPTPVTSKSVLRKTHKQLIEGYEKEIRALTTERERLFQEAEELSEMLDIGAVTVLKDQQAENREITLEMKKQGVEQSARMLRF